MIVETKIKKAKDIAIITSVYLFVTAIIFILTLYIQNYRTNEQIQTKQKQNLTLLMQKHVLQQNVDDYTTKMARLKYENIKLNDLLVSTTNKLKEVHDQLKKITIESRDKESIQKKFLELQAINDKIAEQVTILNKKLANMTKEDAGLKTKTVNIGDENHAIADEPNKKSVK
jgi:predicted nuclease with TOPRIM domain